MRRLTATICLMIAVLLGSTGVSWSDKLERGHSAYARGDFKSAINEFRIHAEKGNAEAQYYLGFMYVLGTGLKNLKDPQMFKETMDEGFRWINKSAQQRNPDALGLLASFHERGILPFKKDLKKAFELRKKAAQTGDALAIYNLGEAVLVGRGIPRDTNAAVTLFKLAASKKLPTAMFNLGVIFYREPGLKDLKKSFMWFDLVTRWQPNDVARGLKGSLGMIKQRAISIKTMLERNMSKNDISQAHRLVSECVAKNYKGC